jgi:UDP-glucose 4-epimerase
MPRLITENNYNAFLNLIVPAINNGVKRVVVFSSMSVYGDQQSPFDETMRTKPEDVYAVSKASMEKTLEILSDVHGFDYTIIRPHNVYGPKQMLHDPYRNVVGIMMNRVMKGLPPIIYGDGNQTRAFSFIDDVIPYVLKTGFMEETKGQIINIGPLEEFTINHLSQTVLKAFGRTDLQPIHVEDRPREVKHAFCTNDKAIRLLGYKTSVTLEEGISKMAEWAKLQGPQEFKYLDDLELKGGKIPVTWATKMM